MSDKKKVGDPIMRLRKANCHNCYKCVRACPVKSITILEDQAQIAEELCIYCGKCYLVCPQDARDLNGDLERVKKMVDDGEPVYISLSSAFSTYFNTTSLKSIGLALKRLGVTRVEETGIGGNRVVEEYTKILESRSMQNVISTLCPGANFLVQKYFPKYVQWMMPVETPLEAHARMMRAAYGQDIRVVGIGPCIAFHKLADMTSGENEIDAYLTYEELDEWMAEKGVKITEEKDPDTHPTSTYRGRYLDENDGLLRALPNNVKYNYKTREENGAPRVREMFMKMKEEDANGYLMIISACPDYCLGGPMVRLAGRDTFKGKDRWLTSLKEDEDPGQMNPSELVQVDVRKEYHSLYVEGKVPTGEELKYLLSLVGRDTPETRLDCSGCGYPTCVDKAIAVFRGLADPFMCIPNAQDKAEAQSNLLFDYSPSGVAVLNMDLTISQLNPMAEEILGLKQEDAKGLDIRDFMDRDFFDHAVLKETSVMRETLDCEKLNKSIAVTFFPIRRHNIYMLVMDDRTEQASLVRMLRQRRDETIQVAQDVVEKQMRIAQEIASLLGETTAETKLAVNRLKQTVEVVESEKEEELYR